MQMLLYNQGALHHLVLVQLGQEEEFVARRTKWSNALSNQLCATGMSQCTLSIARGHLLSIAQLQYHVSNIEKVRKGHAKNVAVT